MDGIKKLFTATKNCSVVLFIYAHKSWENTGLLIFNLTHWQDNNFCAMEIHIKLIF